MRSDRHTHESPAEGERRKAEAIAAVAARSERTVIAGQRVMPQTLLDGQVTVSIDDVRLKVPLPERLSAKVVGAERGDDAASRRA